MNKVNGSLRINPPVQVMKTFLHLGHFLFMGTNISLNLLAVPAGFEPVMYFPSNIKSV